MSTVTLTGPLGLGGAVVGLVVGVGLTDGSEGFGVGVEERVGLEEGDGEPVRGAASAAAFWGPWR
jgi:hypothetical protein